jgi:hypothetical protein
MSEYIKYPHYIEVSMYSVITAVGEGLEIKIIYCSQNHDLFVKALPVAPSLNNMKMNCSSSYVKKQQRGYHSLKCFQSLLLTTWEGGGGVGRWPGLKIIN